MWQVVAHRDLAAVIVGVDAAVPCVIEGQFGDDPGHLSAVTRFPARILHQDCVHCRVQLVISTAQQQQQQIARHQQATMPEVLQDQVLQDQKKLSWRPTVEPSIYSCRVTFPKPCNFEVSCHPDVTHVTGCSQTLRSRHIWLSSGQLMQHWVI